MSEDTPARIDGLNPNQEPAAKEHTDAVAAAGSVTRRPTVEPSHLREASHGVPDPSEEVVVQAAQEQVEANIDEKRAESMSGAIGALDQAEQGTPPNIEQIVGALKASRLGEEGAAALLETRYKDLDQETKNVIMERMRGEQMDPSERVTAEASEQLGELVEGPLGNIQAMVEESKAAVEGETDPAKKEKKEKHHGKLAHKMEELEKWMRVPPKEWGIRFGKTLAGVIALIVLGIILQMAIINKTVGKK